MAHTWKLKSIMVGKAWWPGFEAAGHLASTVRKQREMGAGTDLAFFVCSLGLKPVEWRHPQWMGFPTSINII